MRMVLALVALLVLTGQATAQEAVRLDLGYGLSHDALYYGAASGRAAVLVPQSGASMESWDGFARALKERGIASLALSKPTGDDVKTAVDYLTERGQRDIVLVGASIGGSAILQALAKEEPGSIRQVVLLAPATGPELQSSDIDKLVLVAKSDFFKDRAYSVFEEAAEPKTLVEFEGFDHGQALLTGDHAEGAQSAIMTFLGFNR